MKYCRSLALVVGMSCMLFAAAATADKPAKFGSLLIPSWEGSTASAGQVLEFDSRTGEFEKALIPPLGPERDTVPGMTLGPDRRLYLAVRDIDDTQNNRIVRYTLDGREVGEVVTQGEGGFEFPGGLRFGPDGYLYVTSNSAAVDAILRFSGKRGAFEGAVATNLLTPQEIAFGPDGLLYVSNGFYAASSIYAYDPATDEFLGAFVPTGTGGLHNPVGLAFGPDRNLYVASFPLNAILRFDGDTGEFVDEFASLSGTGLDTPTDLVFGPDGNLYVLARSPTLPNSAVVRFDGISGAFIDIFVPVGAGGLGVLNTGMLFVDKGCSRYGDNGFGNRCFPAKGGGRPR